MARLCLYRYIENENAIIDIYKRMSFNPSNEADFLKNPLFIKWALNPSTELDRYWHDWAKANEGKKELMDRAIELSKSIGWKNQHRMEEDDFNRLKNRLLEYNAKWEIQSRPSLYSERYKKRFSWVWPVAASFLIAGFLWFNYMGTTEREEVKVYESQEWLTRSVPKGMKKIVHLPDGSTVMLNSDSEIRYPPSFEHERTVELVGQAFFEVQRNEELPFTVLSGELITKVLGTSFDVSAYPEEARMHVAVVTGKVQVDTEAGVTTTILPMEATYYDTASKSLQKGSYDYNHLVGWRHRILKFQEESYSHVFERLSKWYNVSFEFAPGVELKGKYSGEFQNENLENILMGMQYSLGISYEIKEEKVKITKN
ncbi:ferric-dicitrate binding protein FerR (iron transport regulator) [Algoriphagus sp. 4150]|uniref:FecR family protein n=1 Tax=Algoriphagus sp. 4150 TaxID=2817756 RepID=UPI00285B04BE|nr:FecR domain-containing protein [Algoriphagus sp. 4150]MDR7130297.1 ferric-dicitrate binding protein FerR (iron transport regulator) [Algoriphagus sp. 4150]